MAWFKEWFNTPYYHILYGNRNDAEAKMFIRNIAQKLQFREGQNALDLACGKGRYSKELASYKLIVKGIDLSEESIREARKNECDNLSFDIHDMRMIYQKNHFDYVFNIFTSFGYFHNPEDNILTLKAVHENLKQGGLFIQDYFNARCIEDNMIPYEQKEVKGITFNIEKEISGNRILKSIRFRDKGKDFHFQEEVNLFSLQDFENMYNTSGLKINAIYGDYELSPFNEGISNRIILISTPV